MIYSSLLYFIWLLLCLWYLGRLKELHHGYYGAILSAASLGVSSPTWGWILVCLGYILIVDDWTQHFIQACDKWMERPIPSDFTYIHKFGAWVLGKYLTWRGKA